MNIITIDFETYYDKDYSLSKMTTEEYIRDERFEVIGVSVKVGDAEPVWFSGGTEDSHQFLKGFSLEKHLVLAHNAMFDGAILSWVYGITPKAFLDTLCMGRALHGTEIGGSLAVLASHYEVGKKVMRWFMRSANTDLILILSILIGTALIVPMMLFLLMNCFD